jgi:predicted DNA-binding mobile mystery protein A
MEPKFAHLRRRQLDRAISKFGLKQLSIPKGGWLREIRQALGVQGRDLAARLGVTPQRVTQLEKSEVEGKVTLEKLKEAAEALNCQLVYAFVPKDTFEATLRQEAERTAREMLEGINRSMALEEQALSKQSLEESIADLTNELVNKLDRSIWRKR